jgi:hypothetical protein
VIGSPAELTEKLAAQRYLPGDGPAEVISR